MSDHEQPEPDTSTDEGDGQGGTSDDDRQPDDTGADGTLGDRVRDAGR